MLSKSQISATKPDVANLMVPHQVAEEIVKTCKELGVKKVWMQPGSESNGAIRFCGANGIDVVYGACIMIERRKETKSDDFR